MGFSIKALAQQVAAEVAADQDVTVTRGNHNTGTRHGGQRITTVSAGGDRIDGDHTTIGGDYIEGDYIEGDYVLGNKRTR
ncbi:hypothetical protein ABT099_23480 [Streptomyces prasinus]|uniref:hypothetical protein n=1 Tax=Streptomyces prasinus TaxID=67345 RepID=UPI003319A521